MTETGMKMDEEEFLRRIEEWDDEHSITYGWPTDDDYRSLAPYLGIELTREERPKDCPFCGGEPVLVDNGEGMWTIRCTNCYVTRPGKSGVFYHDRALAIATWNHRPQPLTEIPTQKELAEAARRAYMEGGEGSVVIDEWSKRWHRVADAVYRVFGLEPPQVTP